MSSSEGRMSSLREKAVAGIDSAYPHETRDQWKSRIFNHILAAVVEAVEGMPWEEPPLHLGVALKAMFKSVQAKERANIVGQLRKGLDN